MIQEYRKLTDKEVENRRKKNIAIAVTLAVLSALFLITTMIRVGSNLSGN